MIIPALKGENIFSFHQQQTKEIIPKTYSIYFLVGNGRKNCGELSRW
tara:strand:+ start:259 stop:399 length:141 start_codon:yes stop_codon:yes gene_type:complete